jgi:hypothetical protein
MQRSLTFVTTGSATRRAAAIFSLLLAAGSALAQEEARALQLKTGRVETIAADVALTELVREAKPKSRAVIQLDGPMTAERRAALEEAGLVIGEYLPPDSFVVSLAGADRGKVNALGFVRWQEAYQPEWKIDPEIGFRAYTTIDRQEEQRVGRASVVVHIFDGEDPQPVADAIAAIPGAQVQLIDQTPGNVTITASMKWNDTVALSDIEEIKYVEDAPENTLRSNANDRWIVQTNVPGLTPLYTAGIRGEGQIIAVQDSALNINHCSFSDPAGNTPGPNHRKVLAYNATNGSSSHGTHVSGTVAGDNGDDTDTRGVAYRAKIVYSNYGPQDESTITSRLALHYSQGARVHTNSWGDDGTTAYTGQCRGIDNHTWLNEDSLVLFAVTNTSALKTPENAKNCLAVGATGGAGSQDSFCSGGRGPTIDGRRKPEVFAPGCSTVSSSSSTPCGTQALTGTSMACPAVAGVAILARQYFIDGFYPTGVATPSNTLNPSAALLKAIIINSAVDMTGITGYPSDQEGWGRVLADNALYFPGDARKLWARDVRNAQGMTTGQTSDYGLAVAAGQDLEIVMAFTDAPAAANAGFAPINDLDLEVIGPGGVLYRGNAFASGQSIVGGAKDAINNVEVVRLTAPTAGAYLVRVRAAAVNVGTQGFALVATGGVQDGPRPLTIQALNPPSLIAPSIASAFNVEIAPGDDAMVQNSATLSYRSGPSGSFITVPLVARSGSLFSASLPAFACGNNPEFFVSAAGNVAGAVNSPTTGSAAPFIAGIGNVITAVDDAIETDTGWTAGAPGDTATTGIWTRVDPVGTSAQPEDDHTAAPGVFAWITGQHTAGQSVGFNDIDGGATTLTSPVFDLSAAGNPTLSYWRWFSAGAEDTFVVSISNDNGASWITVESLLGGAGGWQRASILPASLLPLTSQMRLRFVAADVGVGTVVEAGIDDLLVSGIECNAPAPCSGDADGDRSVNFSDITTVLANFTAVGAPGIPGDADSDGDVDFTDITTVLANFGTTCP